MSETTDPNLLRAAFKTVYRELPGSPIAALIRRWQADDPAFAGSIRDGVPVEQALGNLGVRLCLADRLGEAIDVLSAGLSLAPDHLPLINSIAVALERSGDSQAAERQVERSLALLPGQPDSWIFLGTFGRSGAICPVRLPLIARRLNWMRSRPSAGKAWGLRCRRGVNLRRPLNVFATASG